MRRMIMIIAILISTAGAWAQTGLNVEQFFDEKYAGDRNVTLVNVSGAQVKGEGLSKYKSISETGEDALAEKIRRAVMKDGVNAKSKEVTYKEGRLYFGFYSLGGTRKHRQYLLYLDRRAVGKNKSTLVFIEGDLDEKQVKSMINN